LPVLNDLWNRLWRVYCSKEFIIFLVFGGTAALTNLVVGAALYEGPWARVIPYEVAVWIGSASGMFVNFILNYAFNFNFRGRSAWEQFGTFCVVSLVGTFLTALIASLTLQILHVCGAAALTIVWPVPLTFLSHVFAVGVVTFYSYAAHKYFTFNVGIRRRLFGKGKEA